MATPISSHVSVRLKPVRNSVVKFFFVWIYLIASTRNTLGNNIGIALFVTCIFAIHALITPSVLEKIATVSAFHDIVELVLNKLVAMHFVDLFLLLSDCTLSSETADTIVGPFRTPAGLFKIKRQMNLTGRLQDEPRINCNVRWIVNTRGDAWGCRRWRLLCWVRVRTR